MRKAGAAQRWGHGPTAPDFVTLVPVPGTGHAIVDAPAGLAGLICTGLVDGLPVDRALSSAFGIGG